MNCAVISPSHCQTHAGIPTAIQLKVTSYIITLQPSATAYKLVLHFCVAVTTGFIRYQISLYEILVELGGPSLERLLYHLVLQIKGCVNVILAAKLHFE